VASKVAERHSVSNFTTDYLFISFYAWYNIN